MSQVGDPVDLHAELLQEWRDASKRVTRTYKAWCAGDRPDRRRLHVAFLEAVRHEEAAARRVEHHVKTRAQLADGAPFPARAAL